MQNFILGVFLYDSFFFLVRVRILTVEKCRNYHKPVVVTRVLGGTSVGGETGLKTERQCGCVEFC